MSGGVGSTVTSILLQKEGYEVEGVYMKLHQKFLKDIQIKSRLFTLEQQEAVSKITVNTIVYFKLLKKVYLF